MTRTVLSPTAQRLERLHRKIAKVEEEIAECQGWLLEFSPTEYVLVLGFATDG